MPNQFHKNLVLDDIHAVVARDYADLTARDADTAFQVAANLNKVVVVQSPISAYTLVEEGPAVWLLLGSGGGGVNGPISSTDNAVPRFDGTDGTTLQDSLVTVDDNGVMTIAGELASRHATTVVEVFAMSDFPAPSSGVITLPSGKYIIKTDVSTSDRFEIGSGSDVEISFDDSRGTTLTYTGTDTMFTSVGALHTVFDHSNLLCSGNGAQVFDITGGDFTITESIIEMTGTGTTLGSVMDCVEVNVNEVLFKGQSNGLTATDSEGFNMLQVIIEPDGTGSNGLVAIRGSVNFAVDIDGVIGTPGPSENMFFIDPLIAVPVNIHNITSVGIDLLFEAGTTGPIASFTDVASGTTAATVIDSGGDARFNDIGHGLVVGETVVHTTFSEASYNGTFVITTADADTYEVGLSYVSDDSGLFETTTAQVNDVGHGLSNGDTLSIFGTINFGGGYKIFNVQTDTFEITLGKVFPGSETTGNWDTGSLDQNSKYVSAMFNGASRDSHSLGDIVVGGNATVTVISSQNAFVDLNLNNSAQASTVTSRFTLTDPDTGEIRYDGLHTETFVVRGLVAASSSGGGQRFNFRLLQNGNPLPSPDDVDVPINIGANLSSSPIDWPVVAAPGDLFRIQVENADGTSNVTIDTLKFSVA